MVPTLEPDQPPIDRMQSQASLRISVCKDARVLITNSKAMILALQADLDNGESVKALRRFNRLLSNLPADTWGETQCHHHQAALQITVCHCAGSWLDWVAASHT